MHGHQKPHYNMIHNTAQHHGSINSMAPHTEGMYMELWTIINERLFTSDSSLWLQPHGAYSLQTVTISCDNTRPYMVKYRHPSFLVASGRDYYI